MTNRNVRPNNTASRPAYGVPSAFPPRPQSWTSAAPPHPGQDFGSSRATISSPQAQVHAIDETLRRDGAEELRDAGYRSSLVGKWHLGTAGYYPENQGFDINIGGTHWGAPQTHFYPYRGRGAFGGGLAILGVPLLALAVDPVTATFMMAPIVSASDPFTVWAFPPRTWSMICR
mgnify:CR=1 FL=1